MKRFAAHVLSIDGQRLPALLSLAAAIGGLGCSPATATAAPEPLVAVDFDHLAQGQLPARARIRTQFAAPDVVPGVEGQAWRTDGFSSLAELPVTLDPKAGFTLSLWIALDSFPSDREVPVDQLQPSSIAQQTQGDNGFDLHIDTYGRWGLRVATTSGSVDAVAPHPFPLRQWSHVVASVDPAAGVATVYLDGARVAAASLKQGASLQLAPVPLTLASPARLAHILDFTINRLSAAYDLVAVYGRALSETEIAALPAPAQVPDAEPSLVVPTSRFAGDFLRPQVHPMPPANWTNEPHGLVRFNDAWHMFYQRTPNGPFKTQMHWGHLVSQDLVSWQSLPDALWPELQTPTFGYDMKGIWSGDVIVDGGRALAFYTSVNHGDRLAASNPGISMAVSEDPQLRQWRKLGPILNSQDVRDFRDPFLWKEGDAWHMLIGAALDSGGGLEHLVLQKGATGGHWEPTRFSDVSYRILDVGSVIWEMPVFEQLSDKTWILLVNPIGGRVSKYGDQPTRAVYWTGDWTDGLFHPFFHDPKNLDLVPGHLAPTVARAPDGQLRAIGIVDERRTPASQERAGWANGFGLARTWRLMPDGRTLGQAPAPELAALRGEVLYERQALAVGSEPQRIANRDHAYELQVDLSDVPTDTDEIALDVLASEDDKESTRLLFRLNAGQVAVDKTRSTLSPTGEGPQLLQGAYDAAAFGPMRRLRIFVDGSTVEVFINDAAAYSIRSYPSLEASTGIRLSSTGQKPTTASVQLRRLRRPPATAPG